MLVLLRHLLQNARANFHNPIAKLIVRTTNPMLVPMRRVIPSIGTIDTSSIVLAILAVITEFFLLHCISTGTFNFSLFIDPKIYLLVIAKLVDAVISIYVFSLIAQSIMSWFQVGYNPAMELVQDLTRPMLYPIQRLIPTQGIDISPMIAILLLYVTRIILVGYLNIFAQSI